ncbi:MAG: hypothetical protein K9N62_01735 [Verrucomicrobia bacterium]|jgi:HflK protein|nr:hypothetical protein [Verrucomicrobiota bacterium]
MERNHLKTGLVNVVVSMVVFAATAILAFYSKTLTGQAGLVMLGLGLLVACVSYIQMRLEESERLEKLEFEELTKSKGGSGLFTATDVEILPAQRSREQFERVFLPVFTVFLFLIQAGVAYFLATWLMKITPEGLSKPTVSMALFGLCALILFMVGKYSAGLAQLENSRLLRPGASYLLLGSYICFIVAVSHAADLLGFSGFDLYTARVFAGIIALAAIENLVNLVLEIYRPRVKGKAARPLYESRLVGLLGHPEGLVTTAAQALDYQFGFKVSETWFYRFLEKAFAWIVLLQFALLWLSTTVVFISPGEQGLLERFGRPVDNGALLEPGMHLKLPAPIDTVYRARTRQIQTFTVGAEEGEEHEEEHAEDSHTVLWSVAHAGEEEFNVMVASRSLSASTNSVTAEKGAPVDLLSINIPVQYQINDLRAWFYNHVDSGKLLEKIATREVIRYLVGVDLFDVMSNGRASAALDLRERIQTQANALQLGVDVVLVGLQDIHPPVKVATKFEEVNGASQEKESAVHAAEGYAAETVALASANASMAIDQADAYLFRKVAETQARAARFTNQLSAFRASPTIFSHRAYLKALSQSATNSRKYILTVTNVRDVVTVDLQDKLRPDLLDVPLPGAAK